MNTLLKSNWWCHVWCALVPAKQFVLPWPWGSNGCLGYSIDDIRDYLEENVGRQGWDWVWYGVWGDQKSTSFSVDGVVVRIRKSKQQYGSMLQLLYN